MTRVKDTKASLHAAEVLKKEKELNVQFNNPFGNKVVRKEFKGLKIKPSDFPIKSDAGIVFYNLLQCFMLADNIEESSILNVMHGFSISGIPANNTMDGFVELYKHGYVEFVDACGIKLLGTVNEKSWYKLTPKFYDHLAMSKEQALKTEMEPSKDPNKSRKKYSKEQYLIEELASLTHEDRQLNAVPLDKINNTFK